MCEYPGIPRPATPGLRSPSLNPWLCRHSCHGSWQSLRQSPIFGCFCPSNLPDRRQCDKIFDVVNGNDCIGE